MWGIQDALLSNREKTSSEDTSSDKNFEGFTLMKTVAMFLIFILGAALCGAPPFVLLIFLILTFVAAYFISVKCMNCTKCGTGCEEKGASERLLLLPPDDSGAIKDAPILSKIGEPAKAELSNGEVPKAEPVSQILGEPPKAEVPEVILAAEGMAPEQLD